MRRPSAFALLRRLPEEELAKVRMPIVGKAYGIADEEHYPPVGGSVAQLRASTFDLSGAKVVSGLPAGTVGDLFYAIPSGRSYSLQNGDIITYQTAGQIPLGYRGYIDQIAFRVEDAFGRKLPPLGIYGARCSIQVQLDGVTVYNGSGSDGWGMVEGRPLIEVSEGQRISATGTIEENSANLIDRVCYRIRGRLFPLWMKGK